MLRNLRALRKLNMELNIDMEAFIPREKGCLLDCLDWVPNRGALPNRGACIDACFVW